MKIRHIITAVLMLAQLMPAEAQDKSIKDIMATKPDYVVYIPKQIKDRTKMNPDMRGDSYNDHIHVLYDEGRDIYYGFWTQASLEGMPDHHIVFTRSLDRGATWSEPVVLQGSETVSHPSLMASWQQPMLSKSGRLYLLWNQQVSSYPLHHGALFGAYSDDAGMSWSRPKSIDIPRCDLDSKDPRVPVEWCNWQRPLRLGEGGRYLVGSSRHGKADYDTAPRNCKVEFWQFENIDDDPEIEDIRISYFNTDRDAFDAGSVVDACDQGKPEGPAVEEAAIVGLPDGRLFAMMRSTVGSPVWSVSSDRGKTWTRPKALRFKDGGKVIPHPRSPCPIYDWAGPEAFSGKYFAIVHNSYDASLGTYQGRGPLYILKGRFVAGAEQPIWFSQPELISPRTHDNAFYTSYTNVDGKGILWYGDLKYYVLGKEIEY